MFVSIVLEPSEHCCSIFCWVDMVVMGWRALLRWMCWEWRILASADVLLCQGQFGAVQERLYYVGAVVWVVWRFMQWNILLLQYGAERTSTYKGCFPRWCNSDWAFWGLCCFVSHCVGEYSACNCYVTPGLQLSRVWTLMGGTCLRTCVACNVSPYFRSMPSGNHIPGMLQDFVTIAYSW